MNPSAKRCAEVHPPLPLAPTFHCTCVRYGTCEIGIRIQVLQACGSSRITCSFSLTRRTLGLGLGISESESGFSIHPAPSRDFEFCALLLMRLCVHQPQPHNRTHPSLPKNDWLNMETEKSKARDLKRVRSSLPHSKRCIRSENSLVPI